MFPSMNNIANNPVSFIEHEFTNCPYYSSLLSPLINYYDIDEGLLLLNHHCPSNQPSNDTNHPVDSISAYQMDATEINVVNETVEETSMKGTRSLTRRPLRSDRHSKISTKQGLRDRRMRLSYEVAREFFKLQDILGFDKPSTTIKWLMMKSKKAIEDLNRSKGRTISLSSTSECDHQEVENSAVDDEQIAIQCSGSSCKGKKTSGSCPKNDHRHKTKRITRRNAFHPLVKQSREEARARARERTSLKKMVKTRILELELELENERTPFETGEEESGSLSQPQSLGQRDTFVTMEYLSNSTPSLAFAGNWSPLTSFNCCHDEQVWTKMCPHAEFQFSGASLESYNHLSYSVQARDEQGQANDT